MVKTPPSNAGHKGSVPGWDTKVPHASGCSQKFLEKRESDECCHGFEGSSQDRELCLGFDKTEFADDLDRSSSNSRRDKNIKPNGEWASLVTEMVKNLPEVQETWVGKIPWRRACQSTPVFLPGVSHGQRNWWAAVHGVAKSWTQLNN